MTTDFMAHGQQHFLKNSSELAELTCPEKHSLCLWSLLRVLIQDPLYQVAQATAETDFVGPWQRAVDYLMKRNAHIANDKRMLARLLRAGFIRQQMGLALAISPPLQARQS
jgi:hypothetical protein